MKLLLPLALAAPLLAGSVRVYVTNSAGDNVTIIDPATNLVTGEIKVSRNPHGIAVSPDKSRFYVSSEGDNVLDVVDRAGGKVLRRVPIGTRPNNIAITPDGRRVYVCIRQESWLDVVDTASMERVNRIPVGLYPHNVYCSPDGQRMIATSMGGKKLTIVNIKTEKPEFEIPTGGVPRPVAIESAPDHSITRLFVQLSNLHGFEVIDYPARRIVSQVLLPKAPANAQPLIPMTFSHGMAITPDGKTLWVTSLLTNSVSVFSLPDLKLQTTIPVGNGPDWLTFLPDGSRAYLSNAGSDSVSVLDVATRRELKRIAVGKMPKRLIAVELP